MTSANIQFSLHPVQSKESNAGGETYESLKKLWCDLESESNNTFFVSWSWVACWISVIKPDLFLIKGLADKRLVSLGLLVQNNERRHFVQMVKQCRLQSTGVEAEDQIWPEYNGMLVAKGCESLVYSRLVAYLESQGVLDWDEFVVGPIEESATDLMSNSNTLPFEFCCAPMYQVDLVNLRAAGKGYLESLSKNTRQQLRRSIKHYEKKAELTFCRAQSRDEALSFMDEIVELHKTRWVRESGFHNDLFTDFHRMLVSEKFDSGMVEIVALRCGDEVLGYLYNFLYKGVVYFYLSGIEQSLDNKLKPGLVLHSMCIQNHLDAGMIRYDFLAGDSQYKRSLGSASGQQKIVMFQKQSLANRLERLGRRLKDFAGTAVAGK
ncbi:hypothetical protein A9Q99_20135 [Gammaproteobacteria bacterium 45_16_T64]|nr:hypothetical protein A9Q99_20135 [Gammaproteobacteria bacterium 45_16_T64]